MREWLEYWWNRRIGRFYWSAHFDHTMNRGICRMNMDGTWTGTENHVLWFDLSIGPSTITAEGLLLKGEIYVYGTGWTKEAALLDAAKGRRRWS